MPAGSLLALLDDIAFILDDVAILAKLATKKTVGVLGDDLALNAEQVAGVRAERELPVVWAVMKGSARNKAILVPFALATSTFFPWAVTPLLMVGGAYLCFEGIEKVAHKALHSSRHQGRHLAAQALHTAAAPPDSDVALVELEKSKIKGAIRTDFILSAEIVTLTLGVVATAPLLNRIIVLLVTSVALTVGVYGLVAAIVKLDDLGIQLTKRTGSSRISRTLRGIGYEILRSAPYLMRGLSFVGTIAMFLVGGGIIVHAIAPLHHALSELAERASSFPFGSLAATIAPGVLEGLVGCIVGASILACVEATKRSVAWVRNR